MWGIGKITNKSSKDAFVGFVVGGGGVAEADGLAGSLGNASIALGNAGTVHLTDAGERPGGRLPKAVDVQSAGQTWTWWYDDGARLDVELQDGSFVLTGADQTIAGPFETPLSLGLAAAAQAESGTG